MSVSAKAAAVAAAQAAQAIADPGEVEEAFDAGVEAIAVRVAELLAGKLGAGVVPATIPAWTAEVLADAAPGHWFMPPAPFGGGRVISARYEVRAGELWLWLSFDNRDIWQARLRPDAGDAPA